LQNFDFQDADKLLRAAKNIVITSHNNPDGDAIGSILAMYHFLLSYKKNLTVAVPNNYPGFLKWMDGSDQILQYDKDTKAVKKAMDEADLIFCLDYNSLHRAGDMADCIKDSNAQRLLIDHHPDPELEDFTYYYSVIETSSTAELVYRFIRGMHPGMALGRQVAEGLFVGIMTDTGSFSYACNFPETFFVTGELLQAGVNAERLHRLVYDTFSENRLRLLGYAINQKMVVLPELKTAYIALTRDDLNKFNYQVGDTEGVVNYALSVDGVMVAILLTERKDRIRLSFRSKGNFPVNQIAREYFKGGGHMNAAGGDSFESMDNTILSLKTALEQYKEEIDRSSY
jgi:phosphoesterase RecJ-like protein